MFIAQLRLILTQALPMLVAQVSSMGMMIIDTVLLGHYGTEDLAAVAIGSGIYIAVLFALVGVVQAVAPVVAHHKGGARDGAIGDALVQSFWLALLLAVPCVWVIAHPQPFFALTSMSPAVEAKVLAYMSVLAWGVPAALLYRAIYAFCSALGEPRVLMRIALAGTALHALVAWLLVGGRAGLPALGGVGCALSNAAVNWFVLVCGLAYLRYSPAFSGYRLLRQWSWPRPAVLRDLLRLGLPMGMSYFVEVSSFTLIALLAAELGAAAVAGHRIVGNLAALCYMLPLAVAMATLAQVGLAAGAGDARRAKISALAGGVLAAAASTVLGGLLWLAKGPVVEAYSNDPAVRAVALAMIGYLALCQLFDAVQTVAAFALRGYRVTFVPMLVHIACFWGVVLFGGWWLAFRAPTPLGLAGFWIAALAGLVVSALLLGSLLWRVSRRWGGAL